jgi:hypothetical protein
MYFFRGHKLVLTRNVCAPTTACSKATLRTGTCALSVSSYLWLSESLKYLSWRHAASQHHLPVDILSLFQLQGLQHGMVG